MNPNSDFATFLNRLKELPLTTNPLRHVKTLARELAEGAMLGFFPYEYRHYYNSADKSNFESHESQFSQQVSDYRNERWNNLNPALDLLLELGYLKVIATSLLKDYKIYKLTANALMLTEITINHVFISYRRIESNAFALLLKTYLERKGVQVFLDVSGLAPGDKWHGILEEKVRLAEFFVVLLGKDTLASPYVCSEIRWAMDSKKIIIPISHPKVNLGRLKNAADLEVLSQLKKHNAIRIL